MAHNVFISHSSKDKVIADAACATLEARGIRCWVAPRDIAPGADWGASIIDAITECKVMVLIYSGNSNRSEQVKREVERAVFRNKILVPLRIEDVPPSKSLEYFISTPHWLDALTPPVQDHMARLADAVVPLLSAAQGAGHPSVRPAERAGRGSVGGCGGRPAVPRPAAATGRRASRRAVLLSACGALAAGSAGLGAWALLRRTGRGAPARVRTALRSRRPTPCSRCAARRSRTRWRP